MKRIFASIFAALLATQVWAYDFSAVCSSGQTLYYNITSNTEPYTVEVTCPTSDYSGFEMPTGDLIIPETVSNNVITYMVTNIYDYAFRNCSGLTSVSISNLVTSIGERAFSGCSGVTSVSIPNSVTKMGSGVFAGCSNLVYANDNNAFYLGNSENPYHALIYLNNDNTTCNINNRCIVIPDWGLSQNSSLKSVNIPNSVISIGELAFIYTRVEEINVEANNAYYSSQNGVLFDKDGTALIWYPGGKTETTYVVPNTVTTINHHAFYDGYNLQSIIIGESIDSIGQEAFNNCNHLTEINVESANTKYLSDEGVLFNKDKTTLVCYPAGKTETTYTIPNSVTTIGAFAFFYCSSLSTIIIPNSVKNIEMFAFTFDYMESLTVPPTVETIGLYAFTNVNNVTYKGYATGSPWGATNITTNADDFEFEDEGKTIIKKYKGTDGVAFIPNTVTTIRAGAFNNGSTITSLGIPSSVTTFDDNVFSGCNKLTSVTINNDADFSNAGLYFTQNGIKYHVLNKDEVEVVAVYYKEFDNGDVSFISNTYSGDLVIPDTITMGRNYAVKSIGPYAFCGSNLTSVTIPNSVKSIGANAFSSCNNLKSVTIGDSVETIGNSAFNGSRNLETVNMGNSVTSIGNDAFRWTSLKEIDIPSSVTTIGGYAFAECNDLETIDIPSSVDTVGDYAFWSCNNIKTLTYNTDAFNPSSISRSNLETVVIGDAVTSIPNYAFQNSYNLKSVTVGNSVDSIGNAAFYNCDSLKSIDIPNSVKTIGTSAFYNCDGLKSVTIGNSVKTIGDYAFYDCDSLKSIEIPNAVDSIGYNAFYSCSGLTSLEIPESVKHINDYAFQSCYNIKTLTYNTDAFKPSNINKSNLETVVIGDAVTSIPDYAFYYCSNLKSVTIGNSVDSIGNYAFDGCNNLESVSINSDADFSKSDLYFTQDGIRYHVLNKNEVEVVQNYVDGSNSYSGNVVIPDSVGAFAITGIGNTAFYNCDGLNSVTIGNSVESIGDDAFNRCSNLKSVTLGNSVESIGNYAFYYCSSLSSIDIPESVTYIGNNAFTGTNVPEEDLKLKNQEENQEGNQNQQNNQNQLVLNGVIYKVSGSSVTVTGYSKDANITNVTIPATITIGGVTYPVTGIASKAFANNLNLKSVTIGSNVTTIGESAFSNCRRIESIDIKSSSVTIGDKAFRGCHAAQTVHVPSTVKSVGTEAFMFVKNIEYHGSIDQEPWRALTVNGYVEGDYVYADESKTTLTGYFGDGGDIEIPYGVETIGQYSFFESLGLTSVNIPSTVISIGKGAFSNCHDLESVFVPNSVVMVSADAFCACEGSTIYCQFPEKPAQWSSKWNYQQGGSVVWNSITDIDESATDGVNIYTTDKKIVVENATDDILVYNAMGILIGRDAINRVRTEIPVNAPGVYIVKTGSNVKRVVVN